MKKDKYIPRIIDTIIKEYLDDFTVIYLRGPKWCEKTYTSEHFANSEIKLNIKSQSEEFDRMYFANPKLCFETGE
ncbi:MAG: hypothetical protein SOW65_01320 [Candidatus Enterosoma sp.]|nr:hypothetical protein [bacterium]MDY3210475.1 hypothetical protein [Candidatus Enterosoma sp.]